MYITRDKWTSWDCEVKQAQAGSYGFTWRHINTHWTAHVPWCPAISKMRFEPGSICRNALQQCPLIVTAAAPTSDSDHTARVDRIPLVTHHHHNERLDFNVNFKQMMVNRGKNGEWLPPDCALLWCTLSCTLGFWLRFKAVELTEGNPHHVRPRPRFGGGVWFIQICRCYKKKGSCK